MNIIIQYYKEASSIDLNALNGTTFEQFRKIIFDKFVFINNTNNLKISYSPAVLQYESIQDNASLQKYLSFIKEHPNQIHRLFVRDPNFEEEILENSSPVLENFLDEIKKHYSNSQAISKLKEINQKYETMLMNFSQDISSVLSCSLQEYAQTHLSTIINIQPFSPSEKTNVVSTNKACSVCGESPLYGCIYECDKCTNLILCKFCFERFKDEYSNHQNNHHFYKVKCAQALFSPFNSKNKILTSDYIRNEVNRLQYADSSYEVKILSDLKVFVDYKNEEDKNELKIPLKIKNTGTKAISAMINSPFGNTELNVFKMSYDVPINISRNSETDVIITLKSVFNDKSIGIYYIPIAISKNRKYMKGSVGVIEVKIQVKIPDYREI